ncbi:hypothetical protein IP86_15490 [Rhodopseudomonas sp. AAP120]|jgi:hypothetical protein|uniref:hypothetical protein n=1 Tax=Rhodopseudomonas sp. AAP120 TaxID=1523430 RepID=UPI0006B94D3B|nr:hypothetical protein [Rhodopseudomonas sp. AAP120]KPF96891.1 hypothetical protein IP86_15490 [Rhodopseudomonas sp. AAP120]
MRRSHRLISLAVLLALSSGLAGCGSLGGWDPTDMFDFLDNKKKLAGERKPVFPEGVPGLEQGVPKNLYKGAQQQDQAVVEAAPVAPPPEAKPKRARSHHSAAASRPAAPAPDAEPAPEEDGSTAAAPPAPKPAKQARRRTTAPPADQPAADPAPAQQQGTSAFPAPLPSGTFQR